MPPLTLVGFVAEGGDVLFHEIEQAAGAGSPVGLGVFVEDRLTKRHAARAGLV